MQTPGLPTLEEHDHTSKSLMMRENAIIALARFCDYKNTRVLGKSAHHMQVSDTLDCGDGVCEVSQTSEHTFGIETTVELGGGVSDVVASAGASIGVTLTESWTNGKTKTCGAGDGESVCIWVGVPYQKVKMNDRVEALYPCKNPETVKVNIPEQRGPSDNYYCVRGKSNCRGDGDGYWVDK